MGVLITGGAGFIGSHVARKLLERGDSVVIVDNFNDYYDPKIKTDRMSRLMGDFRGRVIDARSDIRHRLAMESVFAESEEIDAILHLAAQAGVRYSINHPLEVENINVSGTVNMLELAVQFGVENFVFASSSSVYGGNTKIPFSEEDPVERPISPYAATKRACELMAYTYHHLHQLKTTGLRFFTVYGPWGRPDMSLFKFTKAILNKKPIDVYNYGKMKRDFTYIEDIVHGILKALDADLGYEIINLGNSHPVDLEYVIRILGEELHAHVEKNYMPMQEGDVPATYADISKAQRLLGFLNAFKIFNN